MGASRSRVGTSMATKHATSIGSNIVALAVAGKEGGHSDDRKSFCQLKSVSLDNGNGGPGDHVQAATSWSWPDPFADITTHDLRQVQERIAAGEWRADPQAKQWAGHAVGDVLGLDMDDAANRHKARKLIDTWVKNRVLKCEARTDPKTRKERPFISVGERV
jgi:uncharacterized protein YfiM (DUF2279 family)